MNLPTRSHNRPNVEDVLASKIATTFTYRIAKVLSASSGTFAMAFGTMCEISTSFKNAQCVRDEDIFRQAIYLLILLLELNLVSLVTSLCISSQVWRVTRD